MSQSSYNIPELPLWVNGIYQLETTDAALGYNPLTGEDGPANKQWEQLAYRTAYLKMLFEKQHSSGGQHHLTDADFKDGILIPETKLRLNYTTKALEQEIADTETRISAIRSAIDGSQDSGSLSLSGSIQKLVPLSWSYEGVRHDCELFTDSLTMRDVRKVTVTASTAGDDSLDVASTQNIYPGDRFILTNKDGTVYEEVCILSVLTAKRVRCTAPVQNTHTYAYLRATNIPVGTGAAVANRDMLYLSGYLTTLNSCDSGRLIIRHSPEKSAQVSVAYIEDALTGWKEIPLFRRDEYTDYQEDIFVLAASERLRLKIAYTGLQTSTTFYSIILMADSDIVWIEDILQPQILSAECSNFLLVLKGSTFGALYDEKQGGFQVQYARTRDFSTIEKTVTLSGGAVISGIYVNEDLKGMQCFARIRYFDSNGTLSRWSEPSAFKVV